jgi:hypothetical protein
MKMSGKVSNYKDILYSRAYSNDAPPQNNPIKRIALAAIPFLSLRPHFRLPVSILMGTCRIWNSDHKDIFSTGAAVVALAGSIFQHRTGIIVTTIQDITIEIKKIYKGESWEETSKSLIKIFNSLVYLALISRGGLELSILAFALQAVVNLMQARDDFKSKNGHWIEGVANLLMAGVRLQQSHTQYQQLKRNWEIEAAIKRIDVGNLHEKWRFPSDHLPVGIEVNGVKIISWNVLNNAYMEWVTDKDSQGLNGSMISALNVAVNESGLTMRDIVVADMIQNMMAQGQIVALQECSEPFLQHLQQRLPSNWDLVKSFNTQKEDQDVILYNKSQLSYQSDLSETAQKAYPTVLGKPLQNVYFSNQEGQGIRVINSHIPGDPKKPCREEFARYVHGQHKEGSMMIALGDNNFERDEMIEAYRKAGFSDFSLHSPYRTNIDPATKQSKGIDHLFAIGHDNSRDLRPGEILTEGNLQETIDLLNGSANQL